jgi:hypothetical protein
MVHSVPDRFFPIPSALYVFPLFFQLPHFSGKFIQGEGVLGTAGRIYEDDLVEVGGSGYHGKGGYRQPSPVFTEECFAVEGEFYRIADP